MDWNAYVDAYCERLMPGFWGEPLNALSNLAFLAAAWAVWHHQPAATRGPQIRALLAALVLVGAASFTFHTSATRWAGALDVLFIAVYLHLYAVVSAHRALGVRWPWAWLGVPVFMALSQAAALVWSQVAPASGYLGAWTVLLMLLAHSTWRKLPGAPALAAAAGCFAVSLTLRQLDLPLCSSWRWGTHFVWHLLNAVTLGLTTWAMALCAQRTVARSP